MTHKKTSMPPPIEKQLQRLERTCARQAEQLENYKKLVKINAIINSAGLDVTKLLTIIMSAAEKVMHCEASSLMLIDEATNELVYRVALGEKGKDIKEKFRLRMGQGIAGWVAEHGKPVVVADAANDPRFYSKPDEETGFQTRSILCVPLKVRNKTIGILQAINPLHKDAFSRRDLPLFTAFANQVAVAIENANVHRYELQEQRLHDELAIAQKIQQNILPMPSIETHAFHCQAKNHSARMVGGDFYDFLIFDDHKMGVLIGDVSGKGVPAALFMVATINNVRFFTQSSAHPAEIFSRVNNILYGESTFGMFVTATLLVFDLEKKTLTFSNAGHLPTLVYSKEGKLTELKGGKSLPLGILQNTKFEESVVPLNSDDLYILYTDGVTEARSEHNQDYGSERLMAALRKAPHSPVKIVDTIYNEVKKFTGNAEQNDDITVMAAGYSL